MDLKPEGHDEQAPISGAISPWHYRLNYKSGKAPANFAAGATAEAAEAGFSYYDKDAGAKVRFNPSTFVVVDVLMGAGGTYKDGDNFINYYSNIVRNTQTQPIRIWAQGISKPIATGIYNDIKASFPQGCKFQLYMVCVDPSTFNVYLLNVPVMLSDAIKRGIGSVTKTPPNKISMYSLCDLSTRFWVLQFDGTFAKVNEKGEAWTKGECFFSPVLKSAFTLTSNGQYAEIFNKCKAVADASGAYVEASQARIWVADDTPAQEAATMPVKAAAPSVATENAPGWENNDLPF